MTSLGGKITNKWGVEVGRVDSYGTMYNRHGHQIGTLGPLGTITDHVTGYSVGSVGTSGSITDALGYSTGTSYRPYTTDLNRY